MEFNKNIFKIALLRANKTMIEFCRENGFNYVYFNQAVNEMQPMKPEYLEAINDFMLQTKTN